MKTRQTKTKMKTTRNNKVSTIKVLRYPDRKQIARRLVEIDPTLLTLKKLDTLIENIERQYDDVQYIRHLDRMDELGKLADDRWSIDMMDD